MEENFKNKLGFWTFFLLVVFLGVGGYFLTDYLLNEKDAKNTENSEKEQKDYKIDKNKDYIYFTETEVISESAEIYYQDVIINLDTQTHLTETLEKENEIYKNNIKYLDDVELISEELINYNNDNLYALTYREYKTYEYNNYVSLVINDYNYSCFDLSTFNNTKSYIFDTSTGKLLEENEILNIYDMDMDKVKDKIREYLGSKQSIVEEVELIKIDETIENFNNYSLYIDEYGDLYISFLVKTTQVDYNEIMEV